MQNKKPRGIVLDYETSPQLGWFWGSIWETNINKVVQHTQILCGVWKEHGKSQVHYIGQNSFKSYKPGVLNDKELCIHLSELINKFDYVVAHNGDEFDVKVLNTRLAFHGLPPVSTEKTFDTKKISRSKLKLPSNKLNDIAEFFGFGQKLHVHLDNWFGCMQGNKKDWRDMEKYNKKDVVLCDMVFERLLPFTKQWNAYMRINGTDINCSNPVCLSRALKPHKRNRVVNGWRQQYQCGDCGRYTTDSRIMKLD